MSRTGWQVHRVPNTAVSWDGEGRVTVPLWLLRDGEHHSDLPLTLSAAEAEFLHAQLCYVLDSAPAIPLPGRVPDCRKPVQGRSGSG
ncbi:hypothetical protein [Streptomyces daliensis]|uniref:Uncharacterized protein n=1 Tax=Streptomyces daliensis TaxID=299421 RepID=A0A8T4J6B3_9ACTN|nr:hypothetical protein [Streptomyces daliensis]